MLHSNCTAVSAALLGLLVPLSLAVAEPSEPLPWLTDYRQAMNVAREEQKLLMLYFHPEAEAQDTDDFERQVLAQDEIRPLLAPLVLAKLPLSAETLADDKPARLLAHGAFAELGGQAGLAVVDLANIGAPHYGHVVSVHPFRGGKPHDRRQVTVLLGLPPGTLTQRTLIYAVRTHADKPHSAEGEFLPFLAAETQSHATQQARIALQGHHNWEQRFHRINARLPSGLVAQEVCAESWPGQRLVEAAEECVHSWRQSPGHWSAVSARHPLFAYDMKLGRNGVWYAAGIFAHR